MVTKKVKELDEILDEKTSEELENNEVANQEINEELDFGFDTSTHSGYDQVWACKPRLKENAYFDMTLLGLVPKHYSTTNVTQIEGKPVKIVLGSYTYEKKEINTMNLHLINEIKGKKVLFIINFSDGQVMRSVQNSLLGCNKIIEKMSVTIYMNKAGYASVLVMIDGKKANWKYDIVAQNAMVEVIKNKKGEKISVDYSDYVEHLFSEMTNHQEILFPNETHMKFVSSSEVFGEDDDDETDFEKLANGK
jgi:hypothetical protein